MGVQGWYCTRAALWANSYEQPEAVQAHAGAQLAPWHQHAVLLRGVGARYATEGASACALTPSARYGCGFGFGALPLYVLQGVLAGPLSAVGTALGGLHQPNPPVQQGAASRARPGGGRRAAQRGRRADARGRDAAVAGRSPRVLRVQLRPRACAACGGWFPLMKSAS